MRLSIRLGGLIAAALLLTAGTAGTAAADAHPAAQAAIEELRASYGAPGGSAVVRDGDTLWSVTTGTRELWWNLPFGPDHKVRVGSLTKPMTATIVLQLVAEGKIDLDAPVATYLPGVVTGNYDGNVITTRQLLNHTSGIADHLPNDAAGYADFKYTQPQTMATVASWGLAKPALFAPGAGFLYSGTNYFLAGMIIEAVTGRTYTQELTDRIVTPVGLTSTFLPTVKTLPPGHVRGYIGTGFFAVDTTELVDPSIGGPAGGLVSSGADETKFYRALFGGQLLAPAQMTQLLTPNNAPGSTAPNYGLGVDKFVLPCGGIAYGHYGVWPGYQSIAGGTLDGSRAAFAVINVFNGGGGSDSNGLDRSVTLTKVLCDGH
ncbi:D-alanyl-D-alanine carboxypeptidase [Alloactinosynnema sp. L-07]|uniref:serine hydrolase domain-containing protein n=1 Tax=Alloactinosynnema sp. L-07 TaxID=1653480 RepID=UPI00065EF0BB|nr:serine hydrolase domain-containing protein [Alloactinosynnema sp. L-07]CRK61014.1 D-alanyl-D-alanine carboxypeptidase [Alloactinosynnema sp. L-07]